DPPAFAAPSVRRWRHYSSGRFGQVHVYSVAPANEADIKRPPLICMHPSPLTGEMYHAMADVLAADRVVHCPDTPGFGNSDPPPSKPTMTDYGGGVADAVEALGYGGDNAIKQVDIFGFHTGSLVAAEVAAQRPELVRKAVLCGVPHYTPEERAVQRAENVGIGYPFLTDPDYVARMFKRNVLDAKDSGSPEERLRRFGDRLRAGTNGSWGIDAVFTHDTGALLPRLRMPVMLLAFNEMMTQPTRDAAKIMPTAKLVEMPDLPIFGFIVAPERVAKTITTFLDA
ncbi:MAG: alpha/beta hydrolase, partial [Alphaproteobacteria bacterium]|nr:alpha/beta hydrolase [Alphaproteobacteria bacterium]